jgi:hypothetical protein
VVVDVVVAFGNHCCLTYMVVFVVVDIAVVGAYLEASAWGIALVVVYSYCCAHL